MIRANQPGKLELHEDESYRLTVTPQRVKITAETELGAMHGLETLIQLVSADESGYYLPAVTITDRPRFPWRGILIDVARHWLPMDVLKRNIDGLAAVKMNVLHLHLTEDQGFRIESKKSRNSKSWAPTGTTTPRSRCGRLSAMPKTGASG